MRQLLFACIAIAVVAATAPALITRHMNASGADGSPTSGETAAAAPVRARAAASQVEIAAGRDGHFYVDADINFRPVRLMVDTGATVVALRESDAAAAGIRLRKSDFEHPVATANGTGYAAEAELASVAISGIEVSGVRALVLPDDQLSISLLGASFLNRLGRFEVSDGTLIFEN